MAPSSRNLIWGIHPVTEALRYTPDMVREIIVSSQTKSDKLNRIIDLARKKKISVKHETRLRIPGEEHPNHQGVIGVLRDFSYANLGEILDGDHSLGLIVALDSIQDPHNLGAIIRTAAAAGANGLIIPKDRSASITGTVAKVAAGALSHLKICQVTNLVNALKELKDNGYWVYGADGHGGRDIYSSDMSGSCCLVIGSEGKGLRDLVKKNCDQLVRIPLAQGLESLNASVAAGVIIFEIVRQQKSC